MRRFLPLLFAVTILAGNWWSGLVPLASAAGPRPLSDYPRPAVETGMGIHWFPVTGGWSESQVDFYVGEMKQMGISWVKILTGGGQQADTEYLVSQLVQNGIMPVIRLQGKSSENDGDMSPFVRRYVSLGARYFEFYNEPAAEEPNTPLSLVMDRWMSRARETQRAGGIPLLTSLFPSADPGDARSYDAALVYLKQKGAEEIFQRGAGIAVHNYTLNHPVNYPDEPVHQAGQSLSVAEAARFGIDEARRTEINRRRVADKRPGMTVDQDPWGFRMFEAMENRFVRTFGFAVPVISTEGGATVGEVDARYPRVDEALQAHWTVEIAEYMRTKAPSYYFVTMNWLIGNAVMGQPSLPAWEDQSWYRSDRQMPVVGELKKWAATRASLPAAGSTPISKNPAASLPTVKMGSSPAARAPEPAPTVGAAEVAEETETVLASVPWLLATINGKGVITLRNLGRFGIWLKWGEKPTLLSPGGSLRLNPGLLLDKAGDAG